jgi:hypothetical protein
VKNRDVRSAKNKLRDDLRKELDDLDRRWTELQKVRPINDEWINKGGAILERRDLIRMRLEALDGLPKPGPKANPDESKQGDKYSSLFLECVDASRGNMSSARKKFLHQAQVRFGVRLGTAENNWYKVRDAAK